MDYSEIDLLLKKMCTMSCSIRLGVTGGFGPAVLSGDSQRLRFRPIASRSPPLTVGKTHVADFVRVR